jgi:hypothetical protein
MPDTKEFSNLTDFNGSGSWQVKATTPARAWAVSRMPFPAQLPKCQPDNSSRVAMGVLFQDTRGHSGLARCLNSRASMPSRRN